MKKFLRRPWVRRALCYGIALYVRLVWRTSRWATVGAAPAEALWRDRSPFILAFWHGRLLMMPMAWAAGQPMNMLISGHGDGRIIAEAIRHFGLGSIAGSRSKGGSAALRAMLRSLAENRNVGVTPDGPRGPAMRASAGIVAAAKLADVPILPLSYASSRRLLLGSWDRFHLALPFSRGVFLWGEPIRVAADAGAAELEAARLRLEQALNALTAEADRACGHEPAIPIELAAQIP